LRGYEQKDWNRKPDPAFSRGNAQIKILRGSRF
jgi:hypothetical protein